MKKIITIFILLMLTYKVRSENAHDDLMSTLIDYVNACEASYQLKMTHCRGVTVQKTTNCLRHSLSLLPREHKKSIAANIKERLNDVSIKTQAEVEKKFEQILNDNNLDKDKACQIYADDLINKRNDRYYEFRSILKDTFPNKDRN
jgi:hypothetical protein